MRYVTGDNKNRSNGKQVPGSRFLHIVVKLADFVIFGLLHIMRKGAIAAIISLIVIAGIVVYLVLPSPLRVSNGIPFQTSLNGAYRTLINQQLWDQWAKETFIIRKRLLNTVQLDVVENQHRYPVTILLIPLSSDSVAVSWEATFPVVKNPVTRLMQYSQAFKLINKMEAALKNFQLYVKDNKNIYGSNIVEKSTVDTFLISTKFVSSRYPSLDEIYSHINELKQYARSVGAKQSGSPMLHVSTVDSASFRCMVAIPINKRVEDKNTISFVRMVPGKFLTTEIKGGPQSIQQGHRMLNQYFEDFNRIRMAIQFEYMDTDRLKQQDTTKWVTRIYGPVY
jgi:hypothetical protein